MSLVDYMGLGVDMAPRREKAGIGFFKPFDILILIKQLD